ncbi:MAG: NAD(P)/FAD-dependent oxidoreductase [Verrucomicrobia bacterium]|nr:NAD(P)/FAD-dependent oxidoreductase [Verrucomicrobiota bacterium]
MERKKLVVIGGGFAGLAVVKGLKKAPLDITLIDKRNHHLFQPLLYQAATATLSVRDIAIALRQVFAKQDNTTVIMGDVTDIDKKNKMVVLGNGDLFPYDYLVVAIGSRHSYFGNDHFEKNAPGIKTISDALLIRERILTAFEKAERLDSISETHKYLTFVIVGGGPTGVECAGSIAELIQKAMHKNFRRIRTEKARIFLIEGFDRLLPPFHPSLSERTKKDLEKLGVTVLTNRLVTNITEEGVQVGDTFIEARTVIWAAGNAIPPLVQCLETPLDRQGRVLVEKDLSIPGHSEIFVAGDAAHFKFKDKILPGVATVALQQGRFLAKLLLKEAKQSHPSKHRKNGFVYFDKGNLATIGTGKAVGNIGNFRFKGLFAWLIWGFVHIAYLVGFRNRISVMLEWTIHYLTGARSARIIQGTIDENLPKREASAILEAQEIKTLDRENR